MKLQKSTSALTSPSPQSTDMLEIELLLGGLYWAREYDFRGYARPSLSRRRRRRTVFAEHNLVSDAVFVEAHVISCRNVLIYFDRSLQNRAVGLFAGALVRKGFLGLGNKETLRYTGHDEAFGRFVPKERIYRKRDDP